MTTLLLSAGDASGDAHAADLVRALRERRPDGRFLGMGGREMERAGVEIVVDQAGLAVGGLFELAPSLRRLRDAWSRMNRALRECEPDLVVLVDSGGFNLPFARQVRRHSAAPILYFVAPQVWAWRRGRIRKLASRVDRLAVILPFEREVWAEAALRVDFVGHPLVDRLGRVAADLDREQARRRLGIGASGPLVALLPGSRRNEIRHQLPVQLEAARRLHAREAAIGFALAVAPSISTRWLEASVRAARLPESLRIHTLAGRTHEVIRAADVALAKPGSVTVEVMLLERPMVVMGRANAATAAIVRRAVRVPWLAMPNLIAGEPIVPELLQGEARPDAIAQALFELLKGPGRERQLAALARTRGRLGDGGAVAATCRIAEEMLGADPS